MQFVKMVETESFIRYIWVHSSPHCVAIPHPPQFANWGTFPSGEGISAAHHTAKLQFTGMTPSCSVGDFSDGHHLSASDRDVPS